MKFAFYTLGCKVNQYETQAMEQLLRQWGHSCGSFEEACDGYVINTCSVTAVADKKNRAILRRCRREHPDAVIAVCGCYTQHDPEAAARLGADLIGGSSNREAFLRALLEAACAKAGNLQPACSALLDDPLKRRSFEILPAGGLAGRTRAMLKVQDGCTNFCSYCIIPYTRGPVRSAPADLAVEQAKAIAGQGYKEIVITGIEIASWGKDLPGKPDLCDLLEAVSHAVPKLRLRLGSLEPRIVTEDFCRRLQSLPNLCDHFHLSLQSGSDPVLSRMRRKYDTNRYYESVTLLRSCFPSCSITTDMIVAFPGETEEEFSQSLAFIQKCGFSEMHIFPYSRRPGTPADKMPGQHSNAVKEARSRQAIAVADAMSRAYRESFIGKCLPVLFEEPEKGLFAGHAPNYIKVYAQGETLHNRLCNVQITGLLEDGLMGRLAP